MKKLFFLLAIFSTLTTSTFAISLDELRNFPERYKLVFSNSTSDQYLDLPSINVVRYTPPYYTISSRIYSIAYDQNQIMAIDTIYFYDTNQSARSLSKKIPTADELFNTLKENSGIKHQIKGGRNFNYDGSPIGSYKSFDLSKPQYSPQKTILLSGAYFAGTYTFYKAYNVYFNSPADEYLFKR